MADDWTLETIDLGRVRYREADALQRKHHAEVVAGREQSPALQRLLMPRFAFTRRDLLTKVDLAHGPARTVG